MKNPKAPICKAIIDRFKSDATLKTLMGGAVRFYDRVPPERVFPYFALGPVSVEFDDETDCNSGAETFPHIDLYSREPKPAEIDALAEAAVEVLRQDLVVEGHVVVDQAVPSARYLDDPDGLSRHVVLSPRILTDPAD